MSNFLSLVLVLCFLVALVGCKHEQVKVPEGTTAEQMIAMHKNKTTVVNSRLNGTDPLQRS